MIHQQGIHCGGSFPLNPIPGVSCEGVVKGSRSEEGNRSERPGRQEGIHPEQEKAHPDQLQKGNQPLLNPVDEHPFHVHHVLTHPGEQIPAGTVVIPRSRKTLKGGIKVPAQIENHFLLKKIIQKDAKGVESVPTKKNKNQQSHEPGEAIPLSFRDHVIDQVPRQPRINEAEKSRKEGGRNGAERKPGIFAEIGCDAQGGAHGFARVARSARPAKGHRIKRLVPTQETAKAPGRPIPRDSAP